MIVFSTFVLKRVASARAYASYARNLFSPYAIMREFARVRRIQRRENKKNKKKKIGERRRERAREIETKRRTENGMSEIIIG